MRCTSTLKYFDCTVSGHQVTYQTARYSLRARAFNHVNETRKHCAFLGKQQRAKLINGKIVWQVWLPMGKIPMYVEFRWSSFLFKVSNTTVSYYSTLSEENRYLQNIRPAQQIQEKIWTWVLVYLFFQSELIFVRIIL